jgi:two-component system, LytTR family, response regulator LytT
MKILLIEDELPAAKQLTKMLLALDSTITIIDVLDSVEASVKWLQNYPMPDAIFMDIQIADGLSFDIFTQVEITAPVIFTTAFDQYAIKAFKVNAIDYLLKPIDPDDLENALHRLREKSHHNAPDLSKMLDLLQKKHAKERFLIKVGNSFTSVSTSEIAYFFSEEGITQAALLSGKKHIIDHTLDEIEHQIEVNDFFRISRKIVVNVKAIQKVHPHFNSRLKLDLMPHFHEEVFVSRERVASFKVWLGA